MPNDQNPPNNILQFKSQQHNQPNQPQTCIGPHAHPTLLSHVQGQAICRSCKHLWQAITPLPIPTELECPNCLTNHGHFKYPFGAAPDELEWKCNCGCQDFYITKTSIDSVPDIRCRQCGYPAGNWFE